MGDHKGYIRKTLKLAKKGSGLVSPNPMVGAVIVKNNRTISSGWHKAFGLPHAEIEALKKAGDKARGATLYVNMEPCCHYGKTPPCTKAIIEAGIKKVVCSVEDPNPLMAGKGIEEIEKNGITVIKGIMEKEGEEINRAYTTYITKKRPYIVLKWAQTLDGKIATGTGNSKWITGEDARMFVKNLRFEMDGVIVGVNTVIKDNPSLDYISPSFQTEKRLLERKRYWKIILDPFLKIPEEGKIWESSNKIMVVVSEKVKDENVRNFREKQGCEVIKIPFENNRFSLKALMDELYQREIGIVMVEGGCYTLTSFWEERFVDEIMVFISNKILGGDNSLAPISGKEKRHISEAVGIEYYETKKIGDDFFIRGRICFQG
ncbi:MAG: bifunctional diaminohydroxyphosphoribosylaminopyrimidine deaminase/5-amino-6-(5-phosphoribosylamino)uracil reductase RibD [Candidatus Ratteibacteria bacterium]|nr:bifunctional diaminohydroxyphosphoribosylaminopyrimidine deaminase/5-amino-6-(5-phosphoribosylamino)uracil reductase RibD [Candidatus Ratteibacteria bacterium]